MSTIETNRSWTHFRVDRPNPRYCHVTFDHPPINTITATTVAELSDLAGLIEQDPDLNVVVFDSANRDFYLAHYDLDYYHRSRTHLSLGKDAPQPRATHPPEMGSVVALPLVGGLHHRYERRAA